MDLHEWTNLILGSALAFAGLFVVIGVLMSWHLRRASRDLPLPGPIEEAGERLRAGLKDDIDEFSRERRQAERARAFGRVPPFEALVGVPLMRAWRPNGVIPVPAPAAPRRRVVLASGPKTGLRVAPLLLGHWPHHPLERVCECQGVRRLRRFEAVVRCAKCGGVTPAELTCAADTS